jgi:hypothetical protein
MILLAAASKFMRWGGKKVEGGYLSKTDSTWNYVGKCVDFFGTRYTTGTNGL